MPRGRVVLRDRFPDLEKLQNQTELIETGGFVFPNARCIELIRNGAGSKLLDSRHKRAVDRIEADGQIYVSPDVQESLLEALTLPTGRASYGSTAEVFGGIHKLFVNCGISDEGARLFTYFNISTWFPDVLPIAPCLVITGSRPEANVALQLLACLTRHGLPLGAINLAGFRYLPMHIQPTLLIGDLHASMYRTLRTSIYPHAYLPCKDGLIDLYCAKVVYAGTTVVAGGFSSDPILTISLAPCHGKLPMLDSAARQEIAARFQPQLVDYRLTSIAKVRDSDFDVSSFPSNLKLLARVLGTCIVESPELQAGIAPLLEGQQELLRSNRWVDPQCVALEALLAHCHHDQASSRFGIGEIAETATAVLVNRGERTKIEAKAMGNILRTLGFSPKRDSQGYALFLTNDLRLRIHKLAYDYQVETGAANGAACSQCADIIAAQADTGPKPISV